MSLKAKVQSIFTQAPASFVFPSDDTQIAVQPGAALQCPSDHTVTLTCEMTLGNTARAKRNATLLVLLCACSGWVDTSCDAWLASEMRAATVKNRESQKIRGGTQYHLLIDRRQNLVTLTITESSE